MKQTPRMNSNNLLNEPEPYLELASDGLGPFDYLQPRTQSIKGVDHASNELEKSESSQKNRNERNSHKSKFHSKLSFSPLQSIHIYRLVQGSWRLEYLARIELEVSDEWLKCKHN